MSICRCGHSIFRHYDDDQGGNCTACLCPEFRRLETVDVHTLRGTADDDDDIADALCLAEIGARYLGEPLHFPPRRRHIEAMANSIKWPSEFCVKPENAQVGAGKGP